MRNTRAFKEGDILVIKIGSFPFIGIILPKAKKFTIRFNKNFITANIIYLASYNYNDEQNVSLIGSDDLLTYINTL